MNLLSEMYISALEALEKIDKAALDTRLAEYRSLIFDGEHRGQALLVCESYVTLR